MQIIVKYKSSGKAVFAKRYLQQDIAIERLRFFARKTVKYGNVVRIKLGKRVLPAYYCWFYAGFGLYVVFWDLNNIQYDERKIFAIVIENGEHDKFSQQIKAPPTILFAVDWFYPS